MSNGPQPKCQIYTLPQTWYGRLIGAVVGVVLLLLAIFFFTFFLIIFAMAAIAMTVYLSLFGRRYEGPPSPETFRPDIIRVENLLEDSEDESEKRDYKKDNSF
jgi:membrane protein implicated in regulation of membrane protease activity